MFRPFLDRRALYDLNSEKKVFLLISWTVERQLASCELGVLGPFSFLWSFSMLDLLYTLPWLVMEKIEQGLKPKCLLFSR